MHLIRPPVHWLKLMMLHHADGSGADHTDNLVRYEGTYLSVLSSQGGQLTTFRLKLASMGLGLWLLVMAGLASAQDRGQNEPAETGTPNAIIINSSASVLKLSSAYPWRDAPIAQQAGVSDSFGVTVVTGLPDWAVWIKAQPLAGPHGFLPPGRLWVRTEGTHHSFEPLGQSRLVLAGNAFEPTLRSPVAVSVRPSWTDPAGEYTGLLTLRPRLPGLPPDADAGGITEMPLGESRTIEVSLTIPVLFEMSVAQTAISFGANKGPGVYQASSPVEFVLSTNATRWSVRCQPSWPSRAIQAEWPVPLDRIRWSIQCSDPLALEVVGTMDEYVTLFTARQPVENLLVKIEFEIDIHPEDPPGDYSFALKLHGSVDP